MYLLSGSEAFDRPNKASQSHGHALSDVVVKIKDATKFFPWYEIEPIPQEFMSIKIDKNYPDWYVLREDVAQGVPPVVVPPVVPPVVVPPVVPPVTTGITDEQAAQAIVTLLKYCKQ